MSQEHTCVLLVEDYQELLDLFLRILHEGGHEVIATVSAQDAEATFVREGSRVRVLVSDIDMPCMSGLELAASIQEKDCTTGVVLMSGGYLSDAVLGEIAAHGWKFLPKPFSPAALLEAVRGVVDGAPPKAPHRPPATYKPDWFEHRF